MKHTFKWCLFTTAFLCLSLTVLGLYPAWAAESEQVGGVIRGVFVWADNTPVPNCKVKLVNKLDGVSIARDAHVLEMDVDTNGYFQFTKLSPGRYYLFYRTPESFNASEWTYKKPEFTTTYIQVGPLTFAPIPTVYEIKEGQTIDIPPIELKMRVTPSYISEKPGEFLVSWNKQPSAAYSRITIEHKNFGKISHPAYGSFEMKESSYKATNLYPGEHRFMVETITPTERVYAQSAWIDFIIPGEVIFLKIINADKTDPSGRTITWFGSDLIHSVTIKIEDIGFTKTTSDHTIKLPQATKRRAVKFKALDEQGKELIPGWQVTYWQEETK